MNTSHKLLLGASTVLFAAGTTLAIVQPGDLGKDDDVTASASTTTTTAPEGSTSTTEPTSTTATTLDLGAGGTTLTTLERPTTTTTAAPTTSTTGAPVDEPTTTTIASGLGAEGGGTVNPDGTVADTGMESLLGPGLALLALGLAAHRATRRLA